MNDHFGTEPPRWRPDFGSWRRAAMILGLVVLALLGWQLTSRLAAKAELDRLTDSRTVPLVRVVNPDLEPAAFDLTLPGATKALSEASIFARTSGYVHAWNVDIGAKVSKGQILAEIDTPELDEQLRQGEADLSVIEANAALAKATADRWQTLGAGGTVSRQAVDEKTADARAKQAQVTSARANVERLRQLRKFRQVAAPFDGVITSRRVDVGTLVNAGSGAGQELFRMADISKLRVFVQVPQANAGLIHAGISADLKASDHPGRTFKAQVVRNAEAIDPATRTLLVELQTENEDGALFAGAYVEVRFRLTVAERKLSIPMNTLLFRPEGPMVAIVSTGEGGDSIELRRVQIGLDYGSSVQIIDGLTSTDRLVINPLDSISSGQKVRIAQPAPNKAS